MEDRHGEHSQLEAEAGLIELGSRRTQCSSEGSPIPSNARSASSIRESSAPQGTTAMRPERSYAFSTMQHRMSTREPSPPNSFLGQSSIRGQSFPSGGGSVCFFGNQDPILPGGPFIQIGCLCDIV
jgi:hypothetical protein